MTEQQYLDLREELSDKPKEYIIESFIRFIKMTDKQINEQNEAMDRLNDKIEKLFKIV